MFIKAIKLEPSTLVKLYDKHAVLSEEVERVLTNDKTIFKKVGGNQCVAIGMVERYLTIFFEYDNTTKEAAITTAYPSSKKQIKSYKRLTR